MIISRLKDDAYLSTVNLAGTHDSATAYVGMEKVCRCQKLTIAEQLQVGVRLFDIRLYRKGGEFYLCHAIADCYEEKEKAARREENEKKSAERTQEKREGAKQSKSSVGYNSFDVDDFFSKAVERSYKKKQ